MEIDIENLFKYAFNEKFDPFPKMSIKEEKRKYCILDIDGTLNSPNSPDLFSSVLSILSFYRKKLRKNLPEIYELINKARITGKEEYIRKAKNKILECDLHKSLIYYASKIAAENFKFIKNFYPTLLELRELGYRIYLISGSFNPAVNFLTQRFPKKLGIKSKGSVLRFDHKSVLNEIEIMIGKGKAEYIKENLPLEKIKLCVFVTDDIVLDKELIKLGMKYNFPTLVVGEKKETSLSKKPLIIKAKFVRNNAYELVRFARIFETLIITSLQTYEEIEIARKFCRKILESKEKDEIINSSLKLYKLKRKYYKVDELYKYIIQVNYFDEKEVNKIKNFVKERFLESYLPENWI